MIGFKTFAEKTIERKGRDYDRDLGGWKDRESFLAKRLAALGEELERLRAAAMNLLTECEGDIPPSLGALAKLNEALKR